MDYIQRANFGVFRKSYIVFQAELMVQIFQGKTKRNWKKRRFSIKWRSVFSLSYLSVVYRERVKKKKKFQTSFTSWVIRLTRLAGDGLQRQGHLGFRGHGQGLGVRVEGRDHHVGHVHLLGPRRTKHISASRLLALCHSLPDWAPNFTKTHQTKKATSAWRLWRMCAGKPTWICCWSRLILCCCCISCCCCLAI